VDAGAARAQRGEDIRYDLELGFEEAVFGMERRNPDAADGTLRPVAAARFGARHFAGRLPHVSRPREVLYQQSFLTIRRACSTCGGSGGIRPRVRPVPRHGYRQTQRKLKSISPPDGRRHSPAGFRTRASRGANGGPPGDLYVFLKVKEHPFFERHEHDLHCTIPIGIAQAALGAEIKCPRLDQPHKLKTSEGTQTERSPPARQRRAGMNGSGRGDLYIHVDVKVPTRLTREQRKLLEHCATPCRWTTPPPKKGYSRR